MKHAKRKLGLLLAVMMLMQLVLPAMALAADRSNLITVAPENITIEQGGNPIDENFPADSTKPINIELNFRVPVLNDGGANYIQNDDTADIELGKYFAFAAGLDPLPLKAADGTVIGSVSFVNDATRGAIARVTFHNDNGFFASNATNVSAGFKAEFKYDAAKDENQEPEHIIKILGKDFKILLPDAEAVISLDKQGTIDWANGVVNWTVEVKKIGSGAEVNLTGYTFTDVLTDAGDYKGSSFAVGSTSAVSPNEIEGFTYNSTSKTITYNFPDAAQTSQTITFKTVIPAQYYTQAGTITNTAEVSKPHVEPVTDTDTVTIPGWGTKTGKEVLGTSDADVLQGTPYVSTGRYIRWNIIANRPVNGNTVTITDTLPTISNGVSIARSHWYLPNGEAWEAKAGAVLADGSYTYTFDDGSTKVMLSIWQQVPDDTLLTTGASSYTNTADIVWTGITPPDTEITVGSGPVPVGYNAASKEGDIDLINRKVDWTIKVDTRGQAVTDLVIYDLLVYGASGSINLATDTLTVSPALAEFDNIKEKLVPSYGQSYESESFGTSGSLVVHSISKDGVVVADLLVITGLVASAENTFTFTSNVLNKSAFISDTGDNGEGEARSVTNTASLFKGTERITNIPDTVSYTSRLIDKQMLHRAEAAKEKNFNPNNTTPNTTAGNAQGFDHKSRTVIFRFGVNLQGVNWDAVYGNGQPFTLTDKLPTGWSFIKIDGENDYLIYEGAPLEEGADGVLQATTPPADTSFLSSATVTGDTATFKFSKLDKPYVILVRAQLSDEAYRAFLNAIKEDTDIDGYKSIANTAVLQPDGTNVTFTSLQNVRIKDEILSKSFVDSGRGWVTWTVDYKPFELTMPGNKIVDELPIGLDVRVGPNGKLLLMDNNFKAYKLNLNTAADGSSDGTYSQGDEVSLVLDQNISYNNTKRHLTFAFSSAPSGTQGYRFVYITDITGPTGTVKNQVSLFSGNTDQTNTGKAFGIGSADSWAQYEFLGALYIEKTGLAGSALEGAEFTVFAEDGTTVIRTGTTGSDGKLSLRGLPVNGSYILRETKAPSIANGANADYVLDETAYQVFVAGNGTTTITGGNGSTLSAQNFTEETQGNLAITKQVAGNGDRNKDFAFTVELMLPGGQGERVPLEGQLLSSINGGTPVFLMFNSDGIATFTLKHGQTITITGIPMDTVYTVTEDSYAQQGYITSPSTPPTGTIAAGITSSVTVTNTIPVSNFGTLVRIHKVDAATGKSLAGAEFTLYGASGTALQTVTTNADGYAWFAQVPDGNYTIRETKAPIGYYAAQGALALKAEGSFVEYTVKNSLGGSRVPVTGDETGVLGFALMGAALLLGLAAVKKRRDA